MAIEQDGRSPTGRATHERSRVSPSPPTVGVPNAGELVAVPRDAPEMMWDGMPRAIMMWLDFERPTPENLFSHLRCSGYEVPAWMLEEGELKALSHVPSKGTRCVLIYRAMVENWLANHG